MNKPFRSGLYAVFMLMSILRGFYWIFAVFAAIVFGISLINYSSPESHYYFWASILYFVVGVGVLRLFFGYVRGIVEKRRKAFMARLSLNPDFEVFGTKSSMTYLGFDTQKQVVAYVSAFEEPRAIPFGEFEAMEVTKETGESRLFKFVVRDGTVVIRVGASRAWEFQGRVSAALGF